MSFFAWKYSVTSFRSRVFWSVVPIVIALVVVHGLMSVREQRRLATQEFMKRGQNMARNLAYTSELGVLAEDQELLETSIRAGIKDPDVAYVLIYGDSGSLLAQGGKDVGSLGPPRLRLSASHQTAVFDNREPSSRTLSDEHGSLIEFVHPIFSQAGGTPDELILGLPQKGPQINIPSRQQVVGAIRMGLSLESVERQSVGFLQLWGGIAVAFISLSAFVVYGLSRRITRPINQLTLYAEQFGRGELDQVIPVSSRDEIGKLAHTFNQMARSLKGTINEKERLLEDLRALNRSLSESETRFRSVAQSATDAIVSSDSHGNIISWNRGAQTIFGYEEDEIVGKPVTTLMPFVHREPCQAGRERYQRTGHSQAIGKTLELNGLRKDGTEFPLELSLATWETGQDTFFSAIIRDISERKRAEEAQKRLVAILEATTDFVGIADHSGQALYLNRAGRNMIGIGQTEDIFQTSISDYHPAWASELILHEGLPCAERQGVWVGETALRTHDGREIPVSQVILAHKNAHGKVDFFSTIARDITERKRAEAELQALAQSLEQKVRERTAELETARDQALVATRHKSEFLTSMSHELRTPLNAVIGFSEVLLERMFGDLNQKQSDYLEDILSSGRHLLSLINDILDLSKIEAGRIELELTTFSLPAMIESTLTLVRERAARHHLTLKVDIDDRLHECTADERKIKQALLNLLSNAIKFTPEGGFVAVAAQAIGGSARISVQDTGIGIPAEDQARVFDEFYRAKSSLTPKQEGTGLGLALAKRFIELHGGTIRVESQLGQGSTFTITIPTGVSVAPAPSGDRTIKAERDRS